MCFFRFTKDNIQGSKFNEMNDFTASSRTFLSETGILKKYRKCMHEEYTDSSYNLMPVSWFILKQQQFYPHYFCIINANVSGKGVSHLSITVKILLTSQNPWKDLRDFQGTTDQTLIAKINHGDICVYIYVYVYTHMHSYSFSIYILSLFFSIMTYYSILTVVPCAKHRTLLLTYNILYVVVYIVIPNS